MSASKILDTIFSQEGLLSRTLNQFEVRDGQLQMAQGILESYLEGKIALIEAGTGIGKSLAYLVPAVYWALKHQEKTVITTNTIALQEQLLHKDIPFLLQTMGVELKACLVKGMGNYLCLRKLNELEHQPLLFSVDESKEVESIARWAEKTREGSRSDIPFPILPSTWEKVAAEGETCNHVKCPHYKECFFFKARKEAEDAQLLIVNHHLLLADVDSKRQSKKDQSILPPYQRIVVDEAHHLESVALESFAQRLDQVGLLRRLHRLHSESKGERSRLSLLRLELAALPQVPPTLIQKLEIDLPALKRQAQEKLDLAFSSLSHFFGILFDQRQKGKEKEQKLRLNVAITSHPEWTESAVPALSALGEELTSLAVGLQGLQADVEVYKGTPIYEKLSIHMAEVQGIGMRIEEAARFIEKFVLEEPKEKRVRWFETRGSHACLVDASLDISLFLNEFLFSRQRSSVLCSATMATARSFNYLKQRLGLLHHEQPLKEEIYDSPFDYAQRTLLAVPTDLPLPSSPDFNGAAAAAMEELIGITRGGVFLLFTSYEMLQYTYKILSQSPHAARYPFLKQGDLPRHLLLDQFKKRMGSVLFATDSFWEGVDVPGDALRCVVIAKLPFSVPSDPLYEAYAESLQKEGLDPFFDYSVPQAVIKFKQGFGRLMRKKEDRGSVVCLDHRLVKKQYGKQFLESLPKCRTCFATKQETFAQIRLFHGNGA